MVPGFCEKIVQSCEKVETFKIILKGADPPFKLWGKFGLIGTVMINWSVGRIFLFTFKWTPS
jgi:hypothetical protein